MPFAAVGESWYPVYAICDRYVELTVADLSVMMVLVGNETAYCHRYNYRVVTADPDECKVVFGTAGRGAETGERLAQHLNGYRAMPDQLRSVSIDISPAFVKCVAEHLLNAYITFDKFHVVTPL